MTSSCTESSYPEYSQAILHEMYDRHFWYRGRRRFVLAALCSQLKNLGRLDAPLDVADLGGGNGNWLAFLAQTGRLPLRRQVLADLSPEALSYAESLLGPEVEKCQIDLTRPLPWESEFDIVFLLDVLEHFRNDQTLLSHVRTSLRPGGLCVITVPALPQFWSWNDRLAGHFRRYRLQDLKHCLVQAEFRPLLLRYFCFFLTPVYLLARTVLKPKNPEDPFVQVERFHRVPSFWLNNLLSFLFACETPLGIYLPFPWGSSALAIAIRL